MTQSDTVTILTDKNIVQSAPSISQISWLYQPTWYFWLWLWHICLYSSQSGSCLWSDLCSKRRFKLVFCMACKMTDVACLPKKFKMQITWLQLLALVILLFLSQWLQSISWDSVSCSKFCFMFAQPQTFDTSISLGWQEQYYASENVSHFCPQFLSSLKFCSLSYSAAWQIVWETGILTKMNEYKPLWEAQFSCPLRPWLTDRGGPSHSHQTRSWVFSH